MTASKSFSNNALKQGVQVAPGSAHAWLLACRPATLTAAAAPVAVGTAVGYHEGSFQPLPALTSLLGAGFLQIASNLANDVFDYEKGADTEERLGPTRAVQAGLLTSAQMKRGLVLTLTLALLMGAYLTSTAGSVVVLIGIASMLSAVAYTGGPYPLGYHGLGDVFVMIFFGFVAVCGSAFVQLGQVPPLAWVASVPLGAMITNILVVNNLRDRHTDKIAGKKTLAVRFGRKGAEAEYIGLYLISYATPLLLFTLGWTNHFILLPLLTLPGALANISSIRRKDGKDLNASLIQSAKLVFAFGLLFALGIVAAHALP